MKKQGSERWGEQPNVTQALSVRAKERTTSPSISPQTWHFGKTPWTRILTPLTLSCFLHEMGGEETFPRGLGGKCWVAGLHSQIEPTLRFGSATQALCHLLLPLPCVALPPMQSLVTPFKGEGTCNSFRAEMTPHP